MSDLLIYKASAGSGKTYQLTRNYLLMLFREPSAYCTILAVTFTNKASGEMKARILESLYKISAGDPGTAGYVDDIISETKMNGSEVARRAREILSMILNDYSSFYVGTIDKFFQMVIRGFTREIGLQTGYNLELNGDRILTEAVDRLMADLDSDEWLRSWLVKFADERIFSGNSWDPGRDIYRLGTEVFSEKYREIFDDPVSQEEFGKRIASYSSTLSGTLNRISEYLKGKGREAIRVLQDAGLDEEDFAHKGRGVAGYLRRMAEAGPADPGSRVLQAAEDPAKWITATSARREMIIPFVETRLNPLLKDALKYFDDNISLYNTTKAIYQNIYAFGILNTISLKIREISNEKNIFLLSDATFFLKKIIEGNPTPFIYEKAGNYFSHFMLDEFQDTSGFQWQNFAPLIDNSLSRSKSNLIVGDVKQSIYRWRNSDWMILARDVMNYFSHYDIDVRQLNENWRSQENIVAFNNSLFSNASDMISRLILRDTEEAGAMDDYAAAWTGLVRGIYDDALQKVPEKFRGTGGYVTLRFGENGNNDEYNAWLRSNVPGLVRDLQDRGYKAGDITVLVRKGSEGREIASLLLSEDNESGRYNFNVVSNDSLYLTGNPAVNFLVAILRQLSNPTDRIIAGFIRHEYMRYLALESGEMDDLNALFTGRADSPEIHQAFRRFNEMAGEIRFLPLYELTEQITAIFELNLIPENLPYIQAFQDMVLDFMRNETPDISAFLDYWNKNGSSATLGISEAQDAIRIMTIHKSKGLQFKVVIIPFCHWSLTPDSNKDLFLWCKTEGKDPGDPGHVPVKYHKDLLNSDFRKEYLDEKFHSLIDNLNLMYVAFTRAEEELHILAKKDADTSKSGNAGSLLYEIITNGRFTGDGLFPLADPGKYFDPLNLTLLYGTAHTGISRLEPDTGEETVYLAEYPVSRPGDKLRLNIRNAYISGLQEDMTVALGYGTVMHEILSGIGTLKDPELSVNRAFSQGKINEKQKEEIMALLGERLKDPVAAEWFRDDAGVRSERDLFKTGKGILRPDRVIYHNGSVTVVDYKFGNIISRAHERQVKEYMEALQEIRHMPVKGYVWYFSMGQIVEVV